MYRKYRKYSETAVADRKRHFSGGTCVRYVPPHMYREKPAIAASEVRMRYVAAHAVHGWGSKHA